MPSYSYTAITSQGRRVKESVEAASLETAKNSLRGAGYTILEIREQNALNRDIDLPFLGRPKAKDMAVFCRQFVSILRAGVSLTTVLSMLSQQTENRKLTAAIREMLNHYGWDVKGKTRTAEALGISLRTLYRKMDQAHLSDK